MWFDSWDVIGRTVLVGGVAYVALVAVLRLAGKRTLGKLNAFDFVVTVALGSTLATILLSTDVALAEGIAALTLLALAQLLVNLTTNRLPWTRRFVTATPTLVVRDGRMLTESLRAQRINAAEIRQAIRAQGTGDLSRVAAAVLETDGTVSVITDAQAGDRSALSDVEGADREVRPGGDGSSADSGDR